MWDGAAHDLGAGASRQRPRSAIRLTNAASVSQGELVASGVPSQAGRSVIRRHVALGGTCADHDGGHQRTVGTTRVPAVEAWWIAATRAAVPSPSRPDTAGCRPASRSATIASHWRR